MAGPLAGIRVIELAGIGPGPHAATLLADLGAEVVRVQRAGTLDVGGLSHAQLRGRVVVEADLKNPDDVEQVLALIERADVLLEGFRPGVTERLGLGPDDALARNPRLVYGRITGWGQTGPRADRAGHDINYIGLTGVLNAVGHAGERPVPPLNLVGDFGGGSMFLVVGVLAALLERQTSGAGQVIDAAMVDGSIALSHLIWTFRGTGLWSDERGTNMLDTGRAWYDTYRTADDKHMAVGAIEPQFYAALVRGLDLDPATLPAQHDPAGQATLRQAFQERFATKTRDEWAAIFDPIDACVTPILTFTEAEKDDHLTARASITTIANIAQHTPTPRFSRTPGEIPSAPPTETVPITQVWV